MLQPSVCLLLLFSFSTFTYGQQLADIVEKAEHSVVKIELENGGQGSGFVVKASGVVVTNAHVIAGATDGNTKAVFQDGKSALVTGTYVIDKARDIAIIQLSINSLQPLPLSAELPRKTEQLMALGAPMGLDFTVTRGSVSAIRKAADMQSILGSKDVKGTWIQVDVPISPGNSGGPLINQTGEVVAMSSLASVGRAQNLNFGISASDIQQAISKSLGALLIPLNDHAKQVTAKIALKELAPIPTNCWKNSEKMKRSRRASERITERPKKIFRY